MADAGIPNDACVRRAIAEAVSDALIEVQTTPAGTLYAIHRRYWLLAKVQPKWHLYKRVPYDPAVYPLNGSSPAIITIAQPLGGAIPDNGSAIIVKAQPLNTVVSPPTDAITRIAQPFSETPADAGAAIIMIAAGYHQDSELLSPGEQAAITLIAQPLSGASPHLAYQDAKEIYREEKEDIKERRSEPVDDAEVDSFAQRYADQQVLQSLLAERQSLQTLQPGQSGWGATQRRLRALAPEIARLQAICATQAVEPSSTEPEQLPSESEAPDGSRLPEEHQPTSLLTGPAAPGNEEATDLAARCLRLLALQQELAQLKRTPSMHLLARQRIPRLEEAIKHLIASLAVSA